MMRHLARILDLLVDFMIIPTYVLITVVTFANVLGRYLLHQPIPWAEEVGRYGFVWLVFLGTGVGFAYGAHLGMDILVRLLPEHWRARVDLFNRFVTAAFALVLVWSGIRASLLNQVQRSPSLGLNMGYVYLAIPVGMLLTLINLWRFRSPLGSQLEAGDSHEEKGRGE